jgi:hypothetical protein
MARVQSALAATVTVSLMRAYGAVPTMARVQSALAAPGTVYH